MNSKESNEKNSKNFCVDFNQEFDLRINVLYTASLSCPPFTCTLQAFMYRKPKSRRRKPPSTYILEVFWPINQLDGLNLFCVYRRCLYVADGERGGIPGQLALRPNSWTSLGKKSSDFSSLLFTVSSYNGYPTQGWANLDQASKHLEVFRFRDLSPTPKP